MDVEISYINCIFINMSNQEKAMEENWSESKTATP
jgi:hypothetical protein